ncbi:MAG: hypothetical protein Q8S13_10710 [Dehalococcoidia bacterium]|nr:hypothetical protein [Dehalococcoidia bacterium]
MAWKLDEKFRTGENEAIIALIERENPSAHDNAASILTDSAKGLRRPVRWRSVLGHRHPVGALAERQREKHEALVQAGA